jgi:hypothetical protein
MTQDCLAELSGVSKRFGKVVALDGLDLQVRRGDLSPFSVRTGPVRRLRSPCCWAYSVLTLERRACSANPHCMSRQGVRSAS